MGYLDKNDQNPPPPSKREGISEAGKSRVKHQPKPIFETIFVPKQTKNLPGTFLYFWGQDKLKKAKHHIKNTKAL